MIVSGLLAPDFMFFQIYHLDKPLSLPMVWGAGGGGVQGALPVERFSYRKRD